MTFIMLNKKKIISEIKNNGYTIIEKYFSDDELTEIRTSLKDTLNYIHPSNEEDLYKKYYEVKKFNQKLKGNWYDIAPFNLSLLTLLHKKNLIDDILPKALIILKSYFKSMKVIFF